MALTGTTLVKVLGTAIARFSSIDPLVEKFYSISPYAYVNNSPLKYIDPTGKDPIFAIRLVNFIRTTYRISKTYMRAKVSVNNASSTNYIYNHYVFEDKSQDVAKSLIERANLDNYDSAVSEARQASPEQIREQKRRQIASDKEDLNIRDKHDKSVEENITRKEPSGDPKRDLKGWQKIVAGAIAGVGIFEQLTNPDPSKDAFEAHQKAVQEKLNEVPGGPPRFITPLERTFNFLKKINEEND